MMPSRNRSRQHGLGGSAPRTCHNCKQVGHIAWNCPQSAGPQSPKQKQSTLPHETRTSEQWSQQKRQIETMGAGAWQQGQERMEGELQQSLYHLHHEPLQMQNCLSQMAAHRPQHRHLQPLRPCLKQKTRPPSPAPAPQDQPSVLPPQQLPPTPAESSPEPESAPQHTNQPAPEVLTVTERLSILNGLSEALTKALYNTRNIITDHEQRLAQRETRPPRLDEITSFFGMLERTAEQATAQLREYHRASGHSSSHTLGDTEQQFCASWEMVVRGFAEVEDWERRFSERTTKDEDLDLVWEGYVAAMKEFGTLVKRFEEEHLMGDAEEEL
ncbi:uncharacterized protein B0T15DRAFT_504197 [Chaetomium strumarium]|uniref:CCHC-type domain-containing protein n=1 Tax=Chaetomium strumarium TaxID=1170767 RepID=A0AAJ0LZ07_9PEZI|nr:hypothetical protein B0T15DRAFT_504197 [Chaetomium strumarium]